MSETQYVVQYQTSDGHWRPVTVGFSEYGEAMDRFYEEAQRDTAFDHRVVKLEVLSYVTKGGYGR